MTNRSASHVVREGGARRWVKATLALLLCSALAFATAGVGCGGGSESSQSQGNGTHEGSSGSESDGNQGGLGPLAGGDDSASQGDQGQLAGDDLEGPPSPSPSPSASSSPAANQDAQQTQQQSPWGSADADTGAPLPPRRPMNAQAREAYRRGLELAANGNNESARAAFEEALSADSGAYKALYNLGVLTDRAGQENRALEYYRQALRIQADYERAAEGVVNIYVRRGSVPDAVAFVEPLARRWVRNLHLQALYADTLVQANRLEDAVQVARAALRRDERFVPAMIALIKANLSQGRTELAESILDQARAIDANNAELHFLRGRQLRDQNRLGEALEEYRTAVQLRPDYAEARMALGMQFLAGGNYDDAVREFETVQHLVPSLVPVYLNLGDAYRATKQWAKAKAQFDRALQMQDRLPEAHFNLALMYMAAGDQFPNLDRLQSLQRAVEEMNAYRSLMGSRLARDDASQTYLEDLAKQIDREQKRIEREKARAAREAARAARQAAQAAAADAGPGG